MKNLLVSCECSRAVADAFHKKGNWNAYSCDILPHEGPNSDFHIQGDCIPQLIRQYWDFRISFPPCTDLACSGSAHFKKKRENGQQVESIMFFLRVWQDSDVVENPINILCGCMEKGSYMQRNYPDICRYMGAIGFPNRPTQIIHPYMFGHSTTKATCLWIKGLPKLKPTNIVDREEIITLSSGKRMSKWYYETSCLPHKDRSGARSKTFQGIAQAMADQWSPLF